MTKAGKNRQGSKPSPLQMALAKGQRLQAKGKLAEAEIIYRQVLAASPRHPEALYLLASIARSVGRHENAVQLLASAITLNPGNPNYHLSRGVSLEALQRWSEAMADYRRVIEICPDAPEAYNNLGNALHAQGRLDEAVAAYRQTLSLKPDYLDARIHLGHVLKMTGDLEGAINAYRQAMEQAPERVDLYRSLVSVKRFSQPDDPDLQRMRTLLKRPETNPEMAMHLHFALGKACHELRQPSKAFAHWQAANQLMRSSYDYDIELEVERVQAIKAAFDSPAIESLRPDIENAARPIFIVGMPRSGSSLTEQILASHPDVAGTGEVAALRQAIEGQFDFPTGVSGNADRIGRAAKAYLDRMQFFNTEGRPRTTDKTLFNFFYIGMIQLMFPNAAVICCWRDPLDTGLSCYRQYFPDIHRFAYDLYEIGRFYGIFADLMAYWHERLPGFVLDLSYEDLVADQEGQTRRLLDFCDLPWDDACLNFHQTRRAVKTSSATQVREPLYRSGMEQWKPYAPYLEELQRGLQAIPLRLPVAR